MSTVSDSDRIWQALLRYAGKPRTPHYRMDTATLAPLRALLRDLGDPHNNLRIVHIAGSKGKGSTALHLERLLLAHGERVATFTSPHLHHWRERFRVDGAPAAEDLLLPVVRRVLALAGTRRDALRFFDVLTAIALTLFAESAAAWTLLETGIGGRFDATNVVQPVLCILTRMELEHCDVLGSTLAEIAAQKAGIVKPGAPVVCAALAHEASEVVNRAARTAATPVSSVGSAFSYESARITATAWRVTYHGRAKVTFDLTAGAQAQIENAVLALAACEALGLRLQASAVAQACARALPGRCELLPGAPAILLDTAHTPASWQVLRETIEAVPHRHLRFLVGCSSERHLDSLSHLLEAADRVIVTVADPDLTIAPERLKQRVQLTLPDLPVTVQSEMAAALNDAVQDLGSEDLVCVTGSTYLVGRARNELTTADQDRSNPCFLT